MCADSYVKLPLRVTSFQKSEKAPRVIFMQTFSAVKLISGLSPFFIPGRPWITTRSSEPTVAVATVLSPVLTWILQHGKGSELNKGNGRYWAAVYKTAAKPGHGLLVFISNMCLSELLNFLTLTQSGPAALVSDKWNWTDKESPWGIFIFKLSVLKASKWWRSLLKFVELSSRLVLFMRAQVRKLDFYWSGVVTGNFRPFLKRGIFELHYDPDIIRRDFPVLQQPAEKESNLEEILRIRAKRNISKDSPVRKLIFKCNFM